ncbi:MAG: WD40 repeat domain-containing serine/threonine-protein kinase [Proteobacteria bacterium]|nr:WD40 repeat domain-containing serine/threonine-protein kinase [Pseudomonadota bacterium]
MPPEQARGEPADPRSDVYAIGAILYTVLSGAPPISGAHVLADAGAGVIVPLREREPSTPPELVTIVEHAMAFERGDRYATAKELADELRRYAAGQLVRRHEYTMGALLRRWLRRHRTPIAVAASAVVVLAVLLVLGVRGIMHERTRAEANARIAERNLALVEENSDLLVSGQARRVLDDDPSLAFAWLERLSGNGLARADVHALAVRAAARGVGFELAGPRDDLEHLVLGGPGRAFTGSDDGHVWAWHLDTRRGDDLGAHVGPVETLAISRDRRWLASGGTDRTIRLWDLEASTSRLLTGHTGAVRGLAFAPDATSVASTSEDGTLRVWSTSTGIGQVVLEDAYRLWPVAWAADGKQLWAGTGDGRLVTVDASGGKPRSSATKLHTAAVRVLALSPDGTLLATGGEDGQVIVWTIATRQGRRLTAHDDIVRDLVWSGDGTRLVSAGGDRVVRVTPLDGPPLELLGNESGVKGLALSGDGALVAAAGIDRVVRVWPITGGAPRAFHGHRAAVKTVAFTPDGAMVISTSDDDHLRLWPLAIPPPPPVGPALATWIHEHTNMTVATP